MDSMTHSEYSAMITEVIALQKKVDNNTATDAELQRCSHIECTLADMRSAAYTSKQIELASYH